MPLLDWSHCPAVESIPGKVSGAWVQKGTRMPVQTIFENLEAGLSVKKITEVFDGRKKKSKPSCCISPRKAWKRPPPTDEVSLGMTFLEAVKAAHPGSYSEVEIPHKD